MRQSTEKLRRCIGRASEKPGARYIGLYSDRYANWGLNVFPLLKPALNSSYDKVAGHTFMNAPIFLNKCTTEDLLWFANQVEVLEGVHMFDNEIWDASEADLQIWGDVLAVGLAFWVPLHNVTYIADPIVDTERSEEHTSELQSPC